MAVRHGLDESHDLAAAFRYERGACPTGLPTVPIACHDRLNGGDPIAVRIETGVVLGTLQERARDSVSVFRNSRTDLNDRL